MFLLWQMQLFIWAIQRLEVKIGKSINYKFIFAKSREKSKEITTMKKLACWENKFNLCNLLFWKIWGSSRTNVLLKLESTYTSKGFQRSHPNGKQLHWRTIDFSQNFIFPVKPSEKSLKNIDLSFHRKSLKFS